MFSGRLCKLKAHHNAEKNAAFRAFLHGGGGPQVGEVTCGG